LHLSSLAFSSFSPSSPLWKWMKYKLSRNETTKQVLCRDVHVNKDFRCWCHFWKLIFWILESGTWFPADRSSPQTEIILWGSGLPDAYRFAVFTPYGADSLPIVQQKHFSGKRTMKAICFFPTYQAGTLTSSTTIFNIVQPLRSKIIGLCTW
jgi:hypothetical protein